tara:strand:- start:1234 stop:2073 length:840 start_codon:yes stop_codon:yes gene_type:complete
LKNKFQDFNRYLLIWYKKNKRNFTWRESRDPWKILLLEVLSQQTQLERANEYYELFISKYPNPESMARKRAGTILRDWSGLGYNNRALRLHETSKLIAKHGWEEYKENLSSLPGVGEYTKNAIEAFAYGERVIPVDVNIMRVLRRYHGKNVNKNWIEDNLDTLIESSDPRNWNQAIMDLSSIICKSKEPACSLCPIENTCSKFIEVREGPKQSPFKGSSREKRGKILKQLLNSRELNFSDVQKLTKSSQREMLALLYKMEDDKLINVNEEKEIVILTRK